MSSDKPNKIKKTNRKSARIRYIRAALSAWDSGGRVPSEVPKIRGEVFFEISELYASYGLDINEHIQDSGFVPVEEKYKTGHLSIEEKIERRRQQKQAYYRRMKI